jgi:hypothetical protein
MALTRWSALLGLQRSLRRSRQLLSWASAVGRRDNPSRFELAQNAPHTDDGQLVRAAGHRPRRPEDHPSRPVVTCTFMPWQRCLAE